MKIDAETDESGSTRNAVSSDYVLSDEKCEVFRAVLDLSYWRKRTVQLRRDTINTTTEN